MMKISCISMSVIPSFLTAAKNLKKEYSLDLDICHYHLHQIDHAGIEESSILTRLKKSDCIILDIRGRGRAGSLVRESLSGFSGSCIDMKGPESPLFRLARLGSFSGSGFLGENKEKHADKRDQTPSLSRFKHSVDILFNIHREIIRWRFRINAEEKTDVFVYLPSTRRTKKRSIYLP